MLSSTSTGRLVRSEDHPKNARVAAATVTPVTAATLMRRLRRTASTGMVPVGVIPTLGVPTASRSGSNSSAS